MKSSPSAGGTLPCLQAVHMATACPSASLKQHGPYVLLQRGKEAAHAYPPFVEGMALRCMVDASWDNRRLRLPWLSLLLVELTWSSSNHLFWQGGLDG